MLEARILFTFFSDLASEERCFFKDVLKSCTSTLNTLMYESIMTDESFLNEKTKSHKLIIVQQDTPPQQIKRGRKSLRLALASSHKKTDIILTKHNQFEAENQTPTSESYLITQTSLLYFAITTRRKSHHPNGYGFPN